MDTIKLGPFIASAGLPRPLCSHVQYNGSVAVEDKDCLILLASSMVVDASTVVKLSVGL